MKSGLVLSPTISGCLRKKEVIWEEGHIKLIAHYIGLSTDDKDTIIEIREISYRPLYRAVYKWNMGKQSWFSHSYRPLYRAVYGNLIPDVVKEHIFLSPTISGCLLRKRTDVNREHDLIAHYIGLSTYILSQPNWWLDYLIAHYIGLSTTIFSVAFH